MSKAKGGVTVRRSGNGVFCITAPGIDPSQTSMVAVASAKSVSVGIILSAAAWPSRSSAPAASSRSSRSDPFNFDVGRNDVSFEFIIP